MTNVMLFRHPAAPRRRLAALALLLLAGASTVLAQAPRVLVFSKTGGFRHTSIVKGVETFREIGEAYGWDVDWTEDGRGFTDEGLDPYAAIVFMSTTGDVLDSLQQEAFERYIGKGRGYVGVHAAADTEYEWPFYRALVGRQFVQHPQHQEGTIHVVDSLFPGMAGFGDSLRLYEEWYEYTEPYAENLRYLYRVDTNSYAQRGWKGASKMGAFHPLGWVHEYGGGRAFYTGIGHMDATYDLPAFRDHLAAGLHYAISGAEEMPQPRAVGRLLGVLYEVGDLPAAVAWYERAFEATPVFASEAAATFDFGGVSVNLRRGTNPAVTDTGRTTTSGPVLYWVVDDLRDSAEWMSSLGAVPDGESTAADEPSHEIGLRDPWGNRFVLVEEVERR